MADRYGQLVNTPLGRIISKQVGLPAPTPLERHELGQPVISGPVLLGAASGSRLTGTAASVLASIGAEVSTLVQDEVRRAAADAGLSAAMFNPDTAGREDTFKALVFDASGIKDSDSLREAWSFFHPTIRRVRRSGRVIVLGTPPETGQDPSEAIAQRALEGLVRSIGKEVRQGATAQLLYVAPEGEAVLESALRFFLSPRSAYVSGQVVRITPGDGDQPAVDWEQPLQQRVALVTGAARGIGQAIAEVLARDGAHVVAVDIPAQASQLEAVAQGIGGSWLEADITEEGAPAAIASHLLEHHDGVDAIIHNAGITRDKTLGRMDEALWQQVLAVNLLAPQRIDAELFSREVVREHGRVVCVSSISGIAGNAGQTNYGTSKAGIIGMVQAWAHRTGQRGVTINAVAPGFIETQMTAAMPLATREAGRRMNSLRQGGLPVDVAETVAWLASPASGGLNGNVVRVCGQSLIGA
ncbi:MAG TPA: 3-oxoacyl-ACP reductase [Solirubrobacteraceae bacterium]|jgi:3-oxoacyl-[acyl-carrier protein] reductase